MAHYAKVKDGIVVNVIVAELEFFQTFVDSSPGEWIQTSYNTRAGIHYKPNTNEPSEDQSKALRKNFASIGFTYDKQRDAFISLKPYENWILDEFSCLWIPPITRPTDGKKHVWNQELNLWEEAPEIVDQPDTSVDE